MRFKQFIRKLVEDGSAEMLPFGPEHFKEAGIGYAPEGGIPILEAHQLVNSWNVSQATPRFIYGLE